MICRNGPVRNTIAISGKNTNTPKKPNRITPKNNITVAPVLGIELTIDIRPLQSNGTVAASWEGSF